MFTFFKRILESIPEDKSEFKRYKHIFFLILFVFVGNYIYFHTVYTTPRKLACKSTGIALGVERVYDDIQNLSEDDLEVFLDQYKVMFTNVSNSMYEGGVIPHGVKDIYIKSPESNKSYIRMVNENEKLVLADETIEGTFAKYHCKSQNIVLRYTWEQYFVFVLGRTLPLSLFVFFLCAILIIKDLNARKREDEMFRMERFTDIAGVSSGVAHNMRNYLSVIKLNIQYIEYVLKTTKGLPSALMNQFQKQLNMVQKNINMATRMTTDLLEFAKQTTESTETEEIEIMSLVRTVVDMFEESLEIDNNIIMHYEEPTDYKAIYCMGNERLMMNVMMNVLKNATESFDGIKNISKNISVDVKESNGHLMIDIIDNGCGMSEKTLKRIKEPFFTVDKLTGTGLGVSSSDRIIRNMGGTLEFHSKEGTGTTTLITIPINSIERS
jgi:signal transduction histidine kinase